MGHILFPIHHLTSKALAYLKKTSPCIFFLITPGYLERILFPLFLISHRADAAPPTIHGRSSDLVVHSRGPNAVHGRDSDAVHGRDPDADRVVVHRRPPEAGRGVVHGRRLRPWRQLWPPPSPTHCADGAEGAGRIPGRADAEA
jgi:hypothetical protein